MKIKQIILKGVNNFEDFHYSFEDEWTQTIPDSLLLIGPNGCGKTTLLRSIGNLWEIFRIFLEDKTPKIEHSSIFFNCQLAAIEIEDFFLFLLNQFGFMKAVEIKLITSSRVKSLNIKLVVYIKTIALI